MRDRSLSQTLDLTRRTSSSLAAGQAWSDHVAVELYLQDLTRPDRNPWNKDGQGTPPVGGTDSKESTRWAGLQIYFPCPWIVDRVAHLDNGHSGWIANPGRLANKLHTTFANRMGRSTQADFFAATVSRGDIVRQIWFSCPKYCSG